MQDKRNQKQIPHNVLSHDRILRVVLYIRVSTNEQVMHGYSLQAQEEALTEYAEKNNMKIVGIYRDEGVSGGKPAFKRPAMAALLEDVKAGNVDMILFIRLDRWFRNVQEYFKVQEILDQHGVLWNAILEDYETTTAHGRMAVTIFLAVAQSERERTSERITFTNESKRKRKESCTGHVSYGYTLKADGKVKRVVKDPETEQYVQDFWDHYRKYESARLAAMFVNQKHGIKRSYKAWMTMAKSEMHTGTWRGVEDYCPAYISHADWERLRENSIARSPANPARVYLFSGLLRCPACGNTLKATCCRQKRSSGETAEYLSYRCHDKQLFRCDNAINISERKVERILLDTVRQELEKFIVTAEVKAAEKKSSPATATLAKLTEQLRRLNKVFMAGNMDDDEYAKETERIKKKIEEAKEAEKDERPPDLEVVKEFLKSDFETIYLSLDKEDQRRMWRSIIEEIYIKDGGISSIKFRA